MNDVLSFARTFLMGGGNAGASPLNGNVGKESVEITTKDANSRAMSENLAEETSKSLHDAMSSMEINSLPGKLVPRFPTLHG